MQTRSTAAQTTVSRLRAERTTTGLSLREVARRAGIDPAHLSRLERGRVSASATTLSRLAKALGLTDLQQVLEAYGVEA